MPYEVNVYVTSELHQKEGYTPANRAETYIQGAFNNTGNSVNLSVRTETPSAPITENPHGEFTVQHPCHPNFDVNYGSLTAWFWDWLDCNGDDAKDCNLLITNDTNPGNGVALGDRYASVAGGQTIANIPSSYNVEGGSSSFDAMSAVLHEVGHTFMKADVPLDVEHDSGRIFRKNGYPYWTPMGVIGSQNDCEKSINKNGFDHYKMYWDLCCVDKWAPPA